MGRVHKRRPGSRRYCDYTSETLEKCLTAIQNGMTQRKAEETFKIPRRTINNKLKKKHSLKPGYPPIFTADEEEAFVSCIQSASAFGFPVNEFELRCIIKTYLQRQGRTVKRFKNNFPGREWIKNFLKRHQELTVRFASNIKRSRAAINKETLTEYFENLKKNLTDIPPERIWNYDETNLTDNPGSKKVLTKRGTKYPEKICNSSKSSISLMMAGNAAGELLPPYTVYKSSHMWDTWTENGPKGARYSNTSSGWFESHTFSDWFMSLLLPKLKKCGGKSVVIGDNLSSHINIQILQQCRENNIAFICLPANSTHLTQPLDVAFFGPMKRAWRQILGDHKESSGRNSNILDKQCFPQLLKKLLDVLSEKSSDNLKAGFRKCGIYPCDITPLLERLPTCNNTGSSELIEGSFIGYLENKRAELTSIKPRKKKRLQVAPGKSIAHEELGEASAGTSVNFDDEEQEITHKGHKQRKDEIFQSSDDESDFLQELQKEAEEDDAFSKKLEANDFNQGIPNKREFKQLQKKPGEYVIFSYEGQLYPGKITEVNDNGAVITAMEKSLKSWRWPQKEDQLFYPWDDIIGAIDPPKLISKRGLFSVPQLDKAWFECI